MDKNRLRMLTEGGLMIALAIVLSMVKVFKMPQGGSVTAGSMIPIILFAMRWGVKRGVAIGALYGVLQYIIDPFMVSPVQMLLDYPIAFGMLGIAGIAKGHLNSDSKRIKWVMSASILAMLGRTLAHVLSGAIFFYEYAGNMNPWIYAVQYNGSYMLAELIIAVMILNLIWVPVNKAVPVN